MRLKKTSSAASTHPHQGIWKVGHPKASKRKDTWHPNVSTYPLKFSGTTHKLAIFEAGDIRYLLQGLDFLTHGFLVDGKLKSTSAWIKDQCCKHFLLFLTPLQGLWENLPKTKNSKGTSVLFKVPCGCFDLVGPTIPQVVLSVEVPKNRGKR